MFYFKISERRRRGEDRRVTTKTAYREYLSTKDLGEAVALMMATQGTTSATVQKITQAAYVRATRGGE